MNRTLLPSAEAKEEAETEEACSLLDELSLVSTAASVRSLSLSSIKAFVLLAVGRWISVNKRIIVALLKMFLMEEGVLPK